MRRTSACGLMALLATAAVGSAQVNNVPITARVQGVAGQAIGNIAVTTAGASICGQFTFAPGFAFLDDWYDFQWINVEVSYTVGGLPVDADGDGNPDDPVTGELPAIDPQPGQAVGGALPGGVGDTAPYYFNIGPGSNWALNVPPGTHVEGVGTKFIDARSDPAGVVSVITFETYLVVDNLTDPAGWPDHQFCVLAGFRWTYTNATATAAFVGAVAANPALIDTGLGNANPAFTPPGGAGTPGWDAIRDCQLNACPPPIPTVSEWGLIVLGLLTLTAGTIVLRRRRRLAGVGA